MSADCVATEVVRLAGGLWRVVLAGDCGADILARFAGLPVVLLTEVWRAIP